MCGRALDKFQRVPFAVLEHLKTQVGGSPPDLATLRAFYSNSPRVLYRHQQLALDVLGLVRFEAQADAPRVLEAICDKVRAGIEANQLLTETRVILYERRFVLPAPRVVGDLAKRARETVERDVAAAIERAISPATRARWVEQLFEARADGMSCIEFLQEPPGSLNPSGITREAEKVSTLIKVNIGEIPDLPGAEKYCQMYAAKMRNQRPSRFAQRKEPRRSIELVSFLRHSLAAHADTLIRMVDRRVSQLWGRASKKAKADQGALPALTVLLAGVRQAIGEGDKSKDARFDAIVDLVRHYDAGDLKPQSIAARQRALLVKQVKQIRSLLKSLVGLDLKADDASQWPALIAGWKAAYARGVDGLTKAMTPPESGPCTDQPVVPSARGDARSARIEDHSAAQRLRRRADE
jgi:Domain of unknown function (DUF4158)